MYRYPFMQDLAAQKLLAKHRGVIGIDQRGNGYFQFKIQSDHDHFIKEWQEMKKSTMAGRS